jgi:hypothetical protein
MSGLNLTVATATDTPLKSRKLWRDLKRIDESELSIPVVLTGGAAWAR